MQFLVSGIHVDIGESFRDHVESTLAEIHDRHGIDPIEVNVHLSKANRYQFRSDISTHLQRGVIMRSHGEADDAYISFNQAVDHLVHRLRRHKKRLVDFHKNRESRRRDALAPYYVLNLNEEDDSAAGKKGKGVIAAPPVIAELKKEIPTLTVSEAVMRLDLSQEPAMLFHNNAHGGLNLVYQRSDGNIGWVDPTTSDSKGK